MTCIVGLVDESDGSVLLGGDSASCDSSTRSILTRSKVFYRTRDEDGEKLVIGVSGSLRMHQLVRYGLAIPAHPVEMPVEAWMTTRFVDALRTATRDGGHKPEHEGEEEINGALLVGYRGRLFQVNSDLAVEETRQGYTALGAGDKYALGSFYATSTLGIESAQKRVEMALAAAAEFALTVAPPFTFVWLQQRALSPQEAREHAMVQAGILAD